VEASRVWRSSTYKETILNSRTQIGTVALGILFALATGTARSQDVVKIGFASPLTGPQANYGKDNQNGAQMAIDELNSQGPTIGGKKVKFQLQAEDDQADPKQGPLIAQKLVDAKVAGVVGHFNSGVTIPASRVYNEAGIRSCRCRPTSSTRTRASRPRSD